VGNAESPAHRQLPTMNLRLADAPHAQPLPTIINPLIVALLAPLIARPVE
jgi:hypothetical protein